MSEPGNHEQNEPEKPSEPTSAGFEIRDEGPAGTFDRMAHDEMTEQSRENLSPEEFQAQQQAELAREGSVYEALGRGPLPPDLEGSSPLNPDARSILEQQALAQLGALDTGDQEATSQDVERIGQMLAQSGYTREVAEQMILNLRNLNPEQKQELLGKLPEAVPQSSREDVYTQRKGESDQEYLERLVSERKIEQNQNEQLIANAQALARQVESQPMAEYIDDPTLRQQMEGRFKAAKELLHHKIEDFKEYMKVPPKEWLMRGFRYSSVGLAALFLFIIWEMQFIGKMAKKK